MSNDFSSNEQIQRLYNSTKNLKSPSELDTLILDKIRAIEEQPLPIVTNKWNVYLPIAASVLVVVLWQFNNEDEQEKQFIQPIETVQLPIIKESQPKSEEKERNQLPEMFFLPTEDIKNKVVSACTAKLAIPGEVLKKQDASEISNVKEKKSNIPIKLIYPYDAKSKTPECNSVSSQILKK